VFIGRVSLISLYLISGEFNSERLRQVIVDQILEKTRPGLGDSSQSTNDAPSPFANAQSLHTLSTLCALKQLISILQDGSDPARQQSSLNLFEVSVS